MEGNTTPEAVLDAENIPAAGAEGTVDVVPEKTAVNGMTLEELNKTLGKNFPTRESALKSIKDTYSYVGKKTEDIEKEVIAKLNTDSRLDTLAKELAEERKERFFDRNPQYADPSVRKLIERIGGSPQDVVNGEEFKAIFTKVSEYDKTAKLRTVMESNPRIASSRDNLQKARELRDAALKAGNLQGAARDEVESLAVSAVKDAFLK